ncbi:MAG: hypothetical protein KKC80_03330 [Candidatus Margulisbacteria bacterium]|nr:hypothetical protein [Candidatus Margulisiibacteriota bacterium]
MKIKNIFFFIVFFLPFVYSLVVNVKVPLKTYEMLFVLFLLFWFMRGAVAGEIKLRIDRAFYPLLFFFLWVVFTVIISYVGLLSFESMPNWSATRGSFLLNPIIEIFYLLLNILLAIFVSNLIVSKASLKNIYGIMIFSSILVCLYGLQLFLGALLKVPALVLPTMSEKPPVSFFFIPRVTATFKEPNFFAGYMTALIPIGLAFFFAPKTKIRSFLNKKAIVILILGLQLLTLILSMSTGGVISFLASG